MDTIEIEELRQENEELRARICQLESSTRSLAAHESVPGAEVMDSTLSIVVVGASGDLARKKTYPALFNLFRLGMLPAKTAIIGYARTVLTRDEFVRRMSSHLPADSGDVGRFVEQCEYEAGQYDDEAAFKGLAARLGTNRVFYLAVPPNVFLDAARSCRAARSTRGWTRLVVEKPFGHDLNSAQLLNETLLKTWTEEHIYRTDHYLGKEMVQALMVLRFANAIYEPLWNHQYVSCVRITFKEDIDVQGRGGYFDQVGIVRDVMQNHLFQILSLLGMEPPVSLSAEDVRDEKVKLLRSVAPIAPHDMVIGQYARSADGTRPGYKDDDGVPESSNQPTFACSVLHINNPRWMGTPFIIKCGKALNERKAEIRVQFKRPPNMLFDKLPPNELVVRVQPKEAIYLKTLTKEPGLSFEPVNVELDLSYHERFDLRGELPGAYERLILEVLRGDHNLFVRSDELEAAWRIVDPVLSAIDSSSLRCTEYPNGSRGPQAADDIIAKYGYSRSASLAWPRAKGRY